MQASPRAQSIRFRSKELAWMLLLLAFGEVIGIAASYLTRAAHPELSKILAGGAATLFFGSLLGGVVSMLIADFDRRRVQRAARLDFIGNVLADLKSVYDSVDRGRTLIRAHQSAKTYGDEMRNFIEARVKLLNVVRALKFDERGTWRTAEISIHIENMERYLKSLINEFEDKYIEISRSQSLHEARIKRALENPQGPPDNADGLPKNKPWEKIKNLPRISDFMGRLDRHDPTDSEYRHSFVDALDRASSTLRRALNQELE